MKKLISLKMAFILLLSVVVPITPAQAQKKVSTCDDGECTEDQVEKFQNVGNLYLSKCLPKNLAPSQINDYIISHPMSEECLSTLNETQSRYAEIEKTERALEQKILECDNKNEELELESMNNNLSKMASFEDQQCTAVKRAEVWKQCPADINCAILASVGDIGANFVNFLMPEGAPNRCKGGTDGCIGQIATSFAKSTVNFFEALWDLGGWVKNKAKGAAVSVIDWVKGAEAKSSTGQLSMANASADPGVFDMLVNDFPGTMVKIWQGLVGALKHWAKHDLFCTEWSGVAHFSTCKNPATSMDCVTCKTFLNGLCGAAGYITAEVVPAFLTGGLISAAKFGAGKAAKLARLFTKSSAKVAKVVKASPMGKRVMSATSKVDRALQISKGLRATRAVLSKSLNLIKALKNTKLVKVTKSAYSSMVSGLKSGGASLMKTKTGTALVFTKKALKTTGRVLLYPIDNPMTVAAFKAGSKSMDKVLRLGAPKLVNVGYAGSKVIAVKPQAETLLAKVEEARFAKTPNAENIGKLEVDLRNQLLPQRRGILAQGLKENKNLDDIIATVYPELQYGSAAKIVGPDEVLKAEKELAEEISKMNPGPIQDSYMQKLAGMKNTPSRAPAVNATGSIEVQVKSAPKTQREGLSNLVKDTKVTRIESKADKVDNAPAVASKTDDVDNLITLTEKQRADLKVKIQTNPELAPYLKKVHDADHDLLLEAVHRMRKKGMTDAQISSKLDETLSACPI